MSSKDPTATGGTTGAAAVKALKQYRAPKIPVIVTQHLIDESCRNHSGYCMVSEAVKQAAPWARHVASDLQTIRLTDPVKGLRYTYLTPRAAQTALILFDQGKKPPPFTFTLRGAHIGTAFKRTRTPDGKVKKEPINKLGRRRLATNRQSGNDRSVPSTVGGAAMPRIRSSAISTRREFGLRAYVGGFDLDQLASAKVPVGAPSISDPS